MGTDISGATNNSYSITGFKKSNEGSYQCVVSNSCNSISSNAIMLTLNTTPNVGTEPMTLKLNPGDSLNLSISPEGYKPFTYQWVKIVNNEQLIINNATNSTYSIKSTTLNDAGVYSCIITNPCGNTTIQIATVTFTDPVYYLINGYIVYENVSSTSINNTSVYLIDENNITIDTVISDDAGYFIFNKVTSGIYKLKFSTTNQWGGNNPLDALFVNRTFIDLYTPASELKAKAADVNNDGTINPLDALYINRRYIGFIDAFTANDWIFEEPIITVKDQDVSLNIKCICAGDINGSYPNKK